MTAIVGRTVEAHHVEPRLDQRDEGQEMLAVEPVLVEILRRPVRRRDHRHPALDQRGEQARQDHRVGAVRSEEHTSELQSLMRLSYAVFCLKKKKNTRNSKH